MSDISSTYQQLRDLMRESKVEMVTAVQVASPNRRPVDLTLSDHPLIVTIDYMDILSIDSAPKS